MIITNPNQPLVSIIVNCFNGVLFLKDCISSIINQTYKNWEIIFWDNLSTDKSKEILKSFPDKRIKYFCTEKFTTLYEARNLAINKSSGDYIAFLDTDDWWEKNRLEKQINIFLSQKNINLVYSNFYQYNEKTKKKKIYLKNLPSGKTTQKLLDTYKIGILTVLIKRNIFKIKTFDKKFEIIGDFDFFIKLSLDNNFYAINEPLANYRVHKSSTSSKKINLHITELDKWLSINKNKDIFKNYSFKGVKFTSQSLKIKKNFLEGHKFKAFAEILKPPLNLKKLKFLFFFIIPIKILNS